MILIGPYTGNVLGESSPKLRGFFQRVEDWHRWLGSGLESRTTGRVITGACNFLFFLLVLSGPFLWMPRKWSWRNVKAIALFRGGLSGRARDSAQGNPQRGEGRGRGSAEGLRRPRIASENRLAGWSEAWNKAEQQVPGWRSLTLRRRPGGRGPMTFTISTGDEGRPDLRYELTLNAGTGDVTSLDSFSGNSLGRKIRVWLRFLHTGEAGGVAGETIAAIASGAAAMLVWTGSWLSDRRFLAWSRRCRAKQVGESQLESQATHAMQNR